MKYAFTWFCCCCKALFRTSWSIWGKTCKVSLGQSAVSVTCLTMGMVLEGGVSEELDAGGGGW